MAAHGRRLRAVPGRLAAHDYAVASIYDADDDILKVTGIAETTLASYDISGDALERHASHQIAGFLAGWAS